LDANGFLADADHNELASRLRKSPIGALLEFSRAVHAEMDALLSAARTGGSIKGARLFVTTFPCHYCARHIVTSGLDEVQFIEPYPKSKALSLHSDSITTDVKKWRRPSWAKQDYIKDDSGESDPKVLFRPFVGVAPRLYRRAFIKDRSLKDKSTGDMDIGQPRWGGQWNLKKIGYAEVEAKISLDN
jgi:tRNA(Arg) A34 adenosine deaminase TadA